MSFTPFPVDSVSQAALMIDTHHHEVHEGNAFFYYDSITLGSGATQDYLITTPNTTKWTHLVISVDGTAVTTCQMYEATDKTGTTLQSTFNNNRNSANVATTTIRKGTSGGTTDGVLLKTYSSGTAQGNSKSPTHLGFGTEIILKQNTKYILRVTSGTVGNLCNTVLNWYEHTSGQ